MNRLTNLKITTSDFGVVIFLSFLEKSWGFAWWIEMKIRTFVAAFAVKKCGKYEWGKIAGAKRFSNKNNTKKR